MRETFYIYPSAYAHVCFMCLVVAGIFEVEAFLLLKCFFFVMVLQAPCSLAAFSLNCCPISILDSVQRS